MMRASVTLAAVRVETEMAGEALAQPLGGRAGEEGAAMGAHPDGQQAGGLKHPECLPHRYPADAEALAQLTLARQAVARLEAAVADERLDLVHDDLRNAVDVNGTEHVWCLRRVRGLRSHESPSSSRH